MSSVNVNTARIELHKREQCARGREQTRSHARAGRATKKVDKRADDRHKLTANILILHDNLPKGGAAEGTRTPDPIITNDVLYQLSYSGHGRALSKVVRACVDLM